MKKEGDERGKTLHRTLSTHTFCNLETEETALLSIFERTKYYPPSPPPGERSGVFTFSRRAAPSTSGLPLEDIVCAETDGLAFLQGARRRSLGEDGRDGADVEATGGQTQMDRC